MSHTKEITIGPGIIGLLLEIFLYGVLTCQYSTYLVTDFNDSRWLKALIALICTMDIADVTIWSYAMWSWSSQIFLNENAALPYWPYAASSFMLSMTAFLVQSFLTYRFYRLTRHYSGCMMAILLILASLTLGFYVSAKVCTFTSLSDALTVKTPLICWFILEIVTDVMIACALIYTLWQSRSGFRKSDQIIYRLVRATMQTGIFVGICLSVALAIYVEFPETYYFSVFAIPSTRLYSVTIMDTLLIRSTLRESAKGGKTPTSAIWDMKDLGLFNCPE